MSHLDRIMDGLAGIQDTYSDCTIRIQGEEVFSAHRLVLHLHSPVFQAKLNEKARDGAETVMELDLQEDNPDALRTLLHFFYNRSYVATHSMAPLAFHVNVFQIAVKYQTPALSDCAYSSFTDILGAASWNVDELIEAATKLEQVVDTVHGAAMMRRDIILAISNRSFGLYGHQSFKSFIQDYPEWIIELLKVYDPEIGWTKQSNMDGGGSASGGVDDDNDTNGRGGCITGSTGDCGEEEKLRTHFTGVGHVVGRSANSNSESVYGKNTRPPASEKFGKWAEGTKRLGSSRSTWDA